MQPPSDLMMVMAEIRDLGQPIGVGVFATDWIPEGATIAVFGGTATAEHEFGALSEEVQSRSIQVADGVYLVPNERWSPAALFNHSCEPSCRLAGEITLVAARDILPGEALTYDYATSDSTPYDEFECFCETVSCRERITGDDWLDPELQDRYRGWFSPYLQRRIDAMGDVERDPTGGFARR